MKNQNVWVSPSQSKWKVQGEGNQKASKVFPTQKQAIERGREIAKNNQSELIIQRPNGQIREKNSYGNDPYPPKG